MTNTLFVATPSLLATELISEFQTSHTDPFKVLWMGAQGALPLPEGSKIVSSSTYSGFLQFLDETGASRVVFAANLTARPKFWAEALLHRHVLAKLARFELPSANLLLGAVAADFRRKNIEVMHPHNISRIRFRLQNTEQFLQPGVADISNIIRSHVATARLRRSVRIIRETALYGVLHNGEVEELAVEWLSTDQVIRRLSKIDRSKFQRIVLFKRSNDETMITYPVIGTATIENAADHGVTDIIISYGCVIQGKAEMLSLARARGVSIRILESVF
jgi:DUF1009 family protein